MLPTLLIQFKLVNWLFEKTNLHTQGLIKTMGSMVIFDENQAVSNMSSFTHVYWVKQGGASEWRVHSTLIFENLKQVEISKNHFSNIWTSSKNAMIFKYYLVTS